MAKEAFLRFGALQGAVEVPVTQPPKVAQPRVIASGMSMKEIRKQANAEYREHKKFMKATRSSIRALKKQTRKSKAGARLSRRKRTMVRRQISALKKHARQQRIAHAHIQRLYKQHTKAARQATHAAKTRARAAKQAIRAMKAKQRAASPRAQARAARERFSLGRKAMTAAWIMRLIKKAFKQKTIDGRNHGFTKSGKGGRTGRAGFWR